MNLSDLGIYPQTTLGAQQVGAWFNPSTGYNSTPIISCPTPDAVDIGPDNNLLLLLEDV